MLGRKWLTVRSAFVCQQGILFSPPSMVQMFPSNQHGLWIQFFPSMFFLLPSGIWPSKAVGNPSKAMKCSLGSNLTLSGLGHQGESNNSCLKWGDRDTWEHSTFILCHINVPCSEEFPYNWPSSVYASLCQCYRLKGPRLKKNLVCYLKFCLQLPAMRL